MSAIIHIPTQLQAAFPCQEEKKGKATTLSRSLSSKLAFSLKSTGMLCAWQSLSYGLTSIVRTYSTDASYKGTAQWMEDNLSLVLKTNFEGVSPVCKAIESKFYGIKGAVQYPFTAMTWLLPWFSKSKEESPAVLLDKIIKVGQATSERPAPSLTEKDITTLPTFKAILEQSQHKAMPREMPVIEPPKDIDYSGGVIPSSLETIEWVKQKTYTYLCHGGSAPDQQYMNQAMMYGLMATTLFATAYAIKQSIARSDEKEERLKLEREYAALIQKVNQILAEKQNSQMQGTQKQIETKDPAAPMEKSI